MTYPKPDRSNFVPNTEKTPENESLDIGWAEGVFGDGRPYRMEMWAQDQASYLSFIFSAEGLEQLTGLSAVDLLVREGVVRFKSAQRDAAMDRIRDASGDEMWSVNVEVGDEEETFIDHAPAITRYR